MNISKERMIKCPYDANHIMPYDRLPSHLEKCKSPKKSLYGACRYNSYHIEPKELIREHENCCPDRKKFEVIEDDDDWGCEDIVESPKMEMSSAKSEAPSKATRATYNTVISRRTNIMKEVNSVFVEDFDTWEPK